MTEANQILLDRIDDVRVRIEEIEHLFSSGEITDQNQIRSLGLELARNRKILDYGTRYQGCANELVSAREMIAGDDAEMADLARDELPTIEENLQAAENELVAHLRPPDENDGKPVFLEIRAGTGGEEAALFAADLYRMYLNYAASRGWKSQEFSRNETGLHGLKEVICRIEGDDAWADLKLESGVHRVQRIPKTESGGRIHTSACTVAVLPESEESDMEIRNEDVRVDVYRSSGAGGQHVNTTDSAVRLTHIPTGIVVTCQNERSQIKNRAQAMKVLASRLKEKQARESADATSAMRKGQVGSGDRSERIRTYNFPQNRLTDHRIGLTLYKLDNIIEGDMAEVVEGMAAAEARAALGESLQKRDDGNLDN